MPINSRIAKPKTTPKVSAPAKVIPKKVIPDLDDDEEVKEEVISNKKRAAMIQAVKGIYEILPAEAPWREKFENTVKRMAEFYDFKRIETGIIENADLFTRAIGEGTDIVNKEMFYLKSTHGDRWVLR